MTADEWWAHKQRVMASWREEDRERARRSEAHMADLMQRIADLPKPFRPDPATDALHRALSFSDLTDTPAIRRAMLGTPR